MLPFLLGTYTHVGMEFRLRGGQVPVVDYPTSHKWTQTGLGIFENMLSLPQVLTYHTTKLMLQRIKVHEASFTDTTLQQEYQVMWGM